MYDRVEKSVQKQSRAIANTSAKSRNGFLSLKKTSDESHFNDIRPTVSQLMGYIRTRPLGQKEGSTGKDWGLGFGKLKLRHSHLTFDNNHVLPTVGDKNNIGFHPGGLFSENWGNMGYTLRETFSDEDKLVNAVNTNANPGNYNLITNNCQDWAAKVTTSYNSNQDIELTEFKRISN